MRNFAWALGDGESVAVGQALTAAKQQYFLSMGTYGAFDEKILIESTLYGLPMYKVVLASAGGEDVIGIPLTIEASQIVDSELLNVITDDFVLIANTSGGGSYYSANGATQYLPNSPVQPRATMPVSVSEALAHGALFTGGTYIDIDEFNPLIARPLELTGNYSDIEILDKVWYPSNLQTIVSLQTLNGTLQSLIVTPGQFLATETDPNVIGTQRLYTSMSYDIYYSTSADSVAPIVELVDIDIDGTDGSYTAYFSVIVSDANDPAIPDDGIVSRVVVTWTYSDGSIAWETVDLTYDPISGTWQGELTGLTSTNADFVVQAVDSAGNVGINTQKGLFYTPILVEAGADQTVEEGTAVAFNGSAGAAGSLDIQWDFGDGSIARGVLNPTHVYADNGVYTVTLIVNDGEGGAGSDTLEVTVDNVAPAVDVPEEITTQYSDSLDLMGSYADAGTKDVHTYRWDITVGSETITVWGNTEYTINWLEWLSDYPAPGTYAATLTVTDDDGGVGIGTSSVVITKETIEIMVAPAVGLPYDTVAISAAVVDNDGELLLPGAYTFDGAVDGYSIGETSVDAYGNLHLEYTIDAIPVDLTTAYAITIGIADNGYYEGPDGSGTLTIYSPLYLQTKVLADLENLKTDNKQTDSEIDRDIERINQTLLVTWLDASRIHHVQGKEVFQDNSAVVASLLKIKDSQLDDVLRDSIIYDLTKSSEILARIIVDKALALTAGYPDALSQMAAAQDELAQGQALAATDPAAAIGCYMRAWESAQQVGQLLGVEL
ncbi:PKD domain-containing protein [Chloroflexota bacterium]